MVLKLIQNLKMGYLIKEIESHKNNYYLPSDSDALIEKYLIYKSARKAKGVVYTCTTNDYDDINEIKIYKYIDRDWDYVFFTDNEEHIKLGQIGIWKVRPLQFTELDNTRNNRWHKLNPHLLFHDYEQSIYIDGNIVILTDYLFKQIEKKKLDFIIPRHFKNSCIYQEYNDVLNANLDSDEIINKELEIIKKDNMPKKYGFCENNILYRKHNKREIIKIDEEWWDMVKNYAKRDQLSLCYILWKHNFNIKQMNINNSRLDKKNFFVMNHKKGGK